LRRGVTTGTCAAAAAKAALSYLLTGSSPAEVVIKLPRGELIRVPVQSLEPTPQGACAGVLKDGGDDPDVTTGLTVMAAVQVWQSPEIEITGGRGVGTVTRAGLQVPAGQPAINPVPRLMILENLRELLPSGQGARVEIAVPGGEEAARRTMNPQLGIVGGISILGTSGIVEPMSEEAWKTSLTGRLGQIRALGSDTVILTPGRKGERIAAEVYGLPGELLAQMSNFVGYMLEQAVRHNLTRILLVGDPGKLVKLAGGIFHTHSHTADARLEIIAAWLGTLGAGSNLINQVLQAPTTWAAVDLAEAAGYEELFYLLAQKAEEKCQQYLKGDAREIGVVFTGRGDEPLALGPEAGKMGRRLGWCIR